jgi:signal transduction histidine kinase/HAMP domain-containing protein
MVSSRIPWFHRIKIRVLIIGILMSTIPALIIGTYVLIVTKHDLEKNVQVQNEATAERLAQHIDFFLFRIEERLKTARFSFFSIDTKEDRQATLYRILKKIPLAEEVVLFDSKGTVKLGVHRFRIMDESGEKEWRSASLLGQLRQRKEYYGPVRYLEDDVPYMQIAVPAFSEDRQTFIGGIGIKVRLQSLFSSLQVETVKKEQEQSFFLVDTNGQLIAHSDIIEMLQRRQVAHSFIVRHFLKAGNPKQLPVPDKYVSYNGNDVLGVYTIVPRTGWGIVVEEPTESAFAAIYGLLLRFLAFLLLIVLSASVISIFLGLSFTRPIEYLEQLARSIGRIGLKERIFTRRKDEIGRLITVFKDMTERLDMQAKKLLQEKEQLDAIVGGIGIGLALITHDCRIVWMNPLLREWIGHQANEADILCYQAFEGTPAACRRCLLQMGEDIDDSADIITRLFAANEERIFRHNVHRLKHVAEHEPEYLLVVEDITEQRRMEEIAMQADKLSALGLMASGLAHEINNPLATIQVYAEDMEDRLHNGREELLASGEIEDDLRIIRKNVNRAKDITQKLLNFSRKSEWREETIHLPALCKESMSLLSHVFSKKQVQLSLHTDPFVPDIQGDGLQLTQVIVNLLQNALDAVAEGGRVQINISAVENAVSIKVVDNGSGIAPEYSGQLFDPFFTTKPVGQGTGLGLSICYGIVTRMGGTIVINSVQGQGTEVTVKLPVVCKGGNDGRTQYENFAGR